MIPKAVTVGTHPSQDTIITDIFFEESVNPSFFTWSRSRPALFFANRKNFPEKFSSVAILAVCLQIMFFLSILCKFYIGSLFLCLDVKAKFLFKQWLVSDKYLAFSLLPCEAEAQEL
jgi:hypothetical protein